MNKLPPSSRYVCRDCIQRLSRQHSTLLTRPQLRPQSTDTASQDDAPNARLRIHKHWNGDARAKFRVTSPTRSTLHMSKTRSNFHLELNEEQKPNVTNEEPRQMSMRERRMRRRAGIHGSSTAASVETAPLPARIRREIRQEMGMWKQEEMQWGTHYRNLRHKCHNKRGGNPEINWRLGKQESMRRRSLNHNLLHNQRLERSERERTLSQS